MSGMWIRPNYHRATLIQGFRAFLGYLEPYLSHAMQEFGVPENKKYEVIKWIISEELWLVFNICDLTHCRASSHLRIHNYINHRVPFNLSSCFKAHFMVPEFKDWEFGVIVELDGTGLFFQYYTDEPQLKKSSKWTY